MAASGATTSGAFLVEEKEAALKAWNVSLRMDRRELEEPRAVVVEFPFAERGKTILRVGDTSGFFDFAARGDIQRKDAGAIVAMLEQLLKKGKALDTEGLCVLPGRKVWSLRVDIVVLNNDGNAIDVSVWAALAALMHYRRLELSIRNDEVIVHQADERDPIPLAIHHIPIPVTAVISEDGLDYLVDPSEAELAAGRGTVTVAINAENEVCCVLKEGGVGVAYALVQRCVEAARSVAPMVLAAIKKEVKTDEEKRKAAALEQFSWAQKRVGVGRADGAAAPAAKKQRAEA